MKSYDVVSICNALVDLMYEVSDEDLLKYDLTKGNMHLIDQKGQEKLLNSIGNHAKAEELGGSAMNAMRALALLNKKVCFAGMIAQDEFGQKIKSRLNKLEINDRLSTSQDEATGTCMVLVTPDGERTMVTYLGASRLYTEEVIPVEELKQSKYFHFCGYQWDTEPQKKGILKAIDIAKAAGTKISFDLADPFVVTHNKSDFTDIIKKCDIVFANKEEAKILGDGSYEKMAEMVAANGSVAVVKLGAQGALIRTQDKTYQVDSVPTKVVDTTAAGDMFAGGMLYGLVNGLSLQESGKIAATLASDVISRYGATLSQEIIEGIRA